MSSFEEKTDIVATEFHGSKNRNHLRLTAIETQVPNVTVLEVQRKRRIRIDRREPPAIVGVIDGGAEMGRRRIAGVSRHRRRVFGCQFRRHGPLIVHRPPPRLDLHQRAPR